MLARGRPAVCAAIRQKAGRDIEVHEVSCLGRCDAAPAAAVNGASVGADELASADAELWPTFEDPPCATVPPSHWRCDPYDAPADRYGVLRASLTRADAADHIVEALKESGLRGMGGAGFPTGTKWELVRKETRTPKYVICNADESEPGTFKDRVILAELPHLVIEGMILA